jgi:hypothetical protein
MTGLGFEHMVRFVDGRVPVRLFPLGFFGHDAAAAVVADGEVVACAAEERFTRVKHGLNLAGNPLLPRHAMAYCLDAAGVRADDVDVVAHYCAFTDATVEERLTLMAPHLRDGDAAGVARAYGDVYRAMMCRDVVARQERIAREVQAVLHAGEPLFRRAGNDLAVGHDGRGRVVPEEPERKEAYGYPPVHEPHHVLEAEPRHPERASAARLSRIAREAAESEHDHGASLPRQTK